MGFIISRKRKMEKNTETPLKDNAMDAQKCHIPKTSGVSAMGVRSMSINAPAGGAARVSKFAGIPRRNRPAGKIKICARITASGSLNIVNTLNSENSKCPDTN